MDRNVIGVDVGGTKILAGLVSRDGTVLAHREHVTPVASEEALLDGLEAAVRELDDGVAAVGFGIPSQIDQRDGVALGSVNVPLRGVPFRKKMVERLGLPVGMDNDANAAAIAEWIVGAGRGTTDMLMLTLGTGVGGGLILGGKLHAGPGGMAGEIGHVVVEPDGPLCGCGSRGCLETLASASAATRRAIAAGLPRDDPGDLVRLAELARASAGPERELLFAVGRDLGRGLAVAIALLDLRCFVIGGGFGAALDTLLPGIRAGIAERCYGERLQGVRVERAELGADAGWIGAARLGMLRARG